MHEITLDPEQYLLVDIANFKTVLATIAAYGVFDVSGHPGRKIVSSKCDGNR